MKAEFTIHANEQFFIVICFFHALALPTEVLGASAGEKTRDVVFNEWMLMNKVSHTSHP